MSTSWIMVAVVAVALIYAVTVKYDRDCWKDRCERMEAIYADRDVIRIVNLHKRHGRCVDGPAMRLIVGRHEEDIPA